MSKLVVLLFSAALFFFACGKSSDQKNTLISIGDNVRLNASTNSIPVWVGTTDPIIQKDGELFFKIFNSNQKNIKSGFNLVKSSMASQSKFYMKQLYKNRLIKMKKAGNLSNSIDKVISSISDTKLNKMLKIVDRYWEFWRIYNKKDDSISQSFTIYVYAKTKYDDLIKIITKKISESKSEDLKKLWDQPSFRRLP